MGKKDLLEFLFVLIVVFGDGCESVRILDYVETVTLFDCEYIFVWYNIRPPDTNSLSLNSHMDTCNSNITAAHSGNQDLKFNLIGFDMFEIYSGNFQLSLMKKNYSVIPKRYFFLKQRLVQLNAMVIWRPYRGRNNDDTIKVELLDPTDQSPILQPQHILCYSKHCTPPTKPPISKTSPVATSFPKQSQNYDKVFADEFDDDPLQKSVKIYQILAACAGVITILLACMVLLLLVCYRRSSSDREKIHQRLEQMIRSQQAKEQAPIYGNISRRRSLQAKKNEAPSPNHSLTMKRPPAQIQRPQQYYTCSGVPDGLATTQTLLNGHRREGLNGCHT